MKTNNYKDLSTIALLILAIIKIIKLVYKALTKDNRWAYIALTMMFLMSLYAYFTYPVITTPSPF